MNREEALFTIHQVSEQIRIPKPTLRFWEKELEGIIVPFRTRGGQRRYSKAHISIINEIKQLKESGMTLIEIRHLMGGNGDNGEAAESDDIQRLANRVAEVVKKEIHQFFGVQPL